MITNLSFSFLFLLTASEERGTVSNKVLQDSRKTQELEAPGTLKACGEGKESYGVKLVESLQALIRSEGRCFTENRDIR